MRDENINYLKTQEFESLKSVLKKNKEKFTDSSFPPVITSLVPANKKDPVVLKTPEKYVRDYLTYSFSRPEDIFGKGNFCIFSKQGIGTQDIIQGAMASCYLIVTLANMARNPKRIYDLFITKDVNDEGVYGMKVFIQGEPKIVLVDDYFPSKDGKLTFSTSYKKENELWIQICEKVWGKINQGCYLRTFLGTPQEALYFLNPAPAYYVHHRQYQHFPDPLWYLMTISMKKNYILCTNTEEINEDNGEGLFKFHAYCVLDLKETCGVKLIKLRNPWGDKAWKGKYGDVNGREWTEKMKKEVDTTDLRSGSFFMEFEEYIRYFPWSFYSKTVDSWHYNYLKYEVSVDLGDHSIIDRTIMESSVCQDINNILNLNKEIKAVGNHSDKIDTEKNSNKPNRNYYNNNMQENYYKADVSPIKKKEKLTSNSQMKINDNNKKNSNNNLQDNKTNINQINKGQVNKSHSKNKVPNNVPKKNYVREDTLVNLNEIENYKIKPEMLKNGDNKIFSFIDRNTAAAFIKIKKPCSACITFHQPQKRFIKDVQDTFEVPCGVIFVFKYQLLDDDDEFNKIKSNYDIKKNKNQKGKYNLMVSHYHNFEKLYVEIEFENLGEYHILCISQFENFDLKFNLVISTYSNIPLELYFLPRSEFVENWLLLCLKELGIKNKCYSYFDPNEPESYFISYTNHKSNLTGFGIIYYENNSKDTSLKIRLTLNKHSSFIVLNAQKNGTSNNKILNYNFSISKNSYKCLLIQFTQAMHSVEINAKHEAYFDYNSERVVKNYLKTKLTKRIIITENLFLYLIKYDRGFLFYSPKLLIKSTFYLKVTVKNVPFNIKLIDEKLIPNNVGGLNDSDIEEVQDNYDYEVKVKRGKINNKDKKETEKNSFVNKEMIITNENSILFN